jgi:DNA polymerase-3 subunit beta
MAVGPLRLSGAIAGSLRVIVPRKSVLEMLRVIGEGEPHAELRLNHDQVGLICGSVDFFSKVIDGSFPDYQRVIPSGYQRHADIDRELFTAALIRTAILSNEKLRAVRLELEAGRLRIRASNNESEEAEEELEIQYLGELVEMAFNVSYLLDVMNVMTGPRVRIEFSDGLNSILVYDPDGAKEFQYVIMPMRL